jgi:carboxyl-terminal processing protease
MKLNSFRWGILSLSTSLAVCLIVRAAETNTAFSANDSLTTTATRLAPGPDDGRIAYVTARLLEQQHISRHPLDDQYSSEFLDLYVDALDPQHIHFVESDIDEFNAYRTNLDNLTLGPGREADTSPAYKIFNRFIERLQQRTEFADSVLKTNQFAFDTDERVAIDRREAPFPHDLDEARTLWRQRLRAEFLQEELALASARMKSAEEKQEATTNSPVASTNQPAKSDDEAIAEKLTRRYNRTLHMYQESDNADVLEIYLTALAHVYDPHSDYLNQRQSDNFAITMSLALFGIGAELHSEDGYCVISKLHPGPAFKSKKIKEGDKIVAVAQGDGPPVDVVDMNLNRAVQLIRGPKGTEVRLTIIPADNPSERRVVSLIRDEIKLEDQAAKARIIELTNAAGKPLRLGVLDLPSFYSTANFSIRDGKPDYRSTTDDVKRLLQKMEQEDVAGIILDLRRNGGGSLDEAIRLTGLFIKEGPVVQVAGPDVGVQVDGDPDPEIVYDGPLIVLTSRFSASASEILAGALQDYGRAVLVGDISTHGKGTVQNVQQLSRWVRSASPTNEPGVLKLTIRKFYRASGASTQLRGVMPDIVLPSILNYSTQVGESSLENPLKWDTIPGAPYEKFNLVQAYLPELLQRSAARIATDPDYSYIRDDIERFRKEQADKTISLNEKERLKEMEEAEAREKSRKEERLARTTPKPVIYEITLADVDKPGLPAPLGSTNSTMTASTGSGHLGTTVTASSHEGDDDDEALPAVDPPLDETERILADYVSLLQKKATVVVKADDSLPRSSESTAGTATSTSQ